MPKDACVHTLVPDARNAAKSWFEREGVVPINHMFVMRQELAEARPDIVRELYRMFSESRTLSQDLPAIFPPLGLKANRKGLQLAIDWAVEQQIIPKPMLVDELFDDVTGSLD